MQAYVTACKLMSLHASSCICMHSGTFCMHSGTDRRTDRQTEDIRTCWAAALQLKRWRLRAPDTPGQDEWTKIIIHRKKITCVHNSVGPNSKIWPNTEYIQIFKIHRIPNTKFIQFLKNDRLRIPNSAIWIVYE